MAFDPVSLTQLEAVAAEFHVEVKPSPHEKKQVKAAAPASKKSEKSFDLDSWILRHIPDANGPTPYSNGGRIWIMPDCIFRPGDGPTMFIIQLANGAISAGCQHATCPGSKASGNHWQELREHFEGPKLFIHGASSFDLDRELCTLARTEYGLAERFRRRFGTHCRFIESWGGKWLIYNGRYWEQSDCAASLYAQETIRAIRREAWQLKETTDDEGKDRGSGTHEMGDGVPKSESD
jgi:hypothetical protein